MKLKILPTLKEKKRYIKFQIISEQPISYSDLEQAILNTSLDFFGEFEASRLSLSLIDNLWKQNEQIGILKCNHKAVQKAIVCFGLIQRLGDIRIRTKILKISGTLKKLK